MTHGILSAFRVGVLGRCCRLARSACGNRLARSRALARLICWPDLLARFASSICWLDRLTALGFSQSHQATGL
ncbi:hypothetical protein H6G52_04805 [Limnothrix sp. FACHB-881]|uniref:hypothetical protein n=1 Tax=Limnothrix sp. FACHB-881 TaxID=2692819 RepID=UPI001687BEAD|nr:hypothetical protein [Limnothrix sp. FACHB-881]MBD2634673.1 hypothetical protein [Limnothrix sp. FACHB-881]